MQGATASVRSRGMPLCLRNVGEEDVHVKKKWVLFCQAIFKHFSLARLELSHEGTVACLPCLLIVHLVVKCDWH